MKSFILLAATSLLFLSCDGDDDCNCSQARYERTVVYTPSNELVNSTGWNQNGDSEPINSSDCSQNGTTGETGETDVTVLADGNTQKTEYEYRITCQ